MALDHSRFFFLKVEALDIHHSTIPIIFTRLISNFCAPIFVLLAGISARLVENRIGLKQTSLKLITRGFWLILLEVTLVRFGFGYFKFNYIVFQVIFVIGFSMILLAGVMYLSKNIILVLSLFIIFSHNMLDNLDVSKFSPFYQNLFIVLHQGGEFEYFNGFILDVWYPLIPWPAVMFIGYYLGEFYVRPDSGRKKIFVISGLLCLGLFFVLRGFHLYGDISDWNANLGFGAAIFGFLNCTKYPPSLHFLLLTLSVGLLLLGILETIKLKQTNLFIFFGKCSLVFYVVHLFVLSLTKRFFGGLVSTDYSSFAMFKVYLIWIILIAVMYFICSYYKSFKLSKPLKS